MSSREDMLLGQLITTQRLDDRALQILTDGRTHAPAAVQWALARNPFMASFTVSELALGSYEVHRS